MQSELLIGSTDEGAVVRVVGRGTMQESLAFQAAVKACFQSSARLVVFDATECEYLDSTFLGCLIGLQKASERCGSRFAIAASPSKRIQLFSTSSLDHYFEFVEIAPESLEILAPIDIERLQPATLGRHVAGCHQELADRGGRDSEAFQSIADRLKKELGEELGEEPRD